MVQPRFRPFDAIVSHTKTLAQHKENSSRLAMSFGSFTTSGWGEFLPEEPIMFDSPYLYRPSVSCGWSLEDEDDAAELRLTRYPRCNCGVIQWHRTNKGLYTGASVVVTVEDRSPFIEPTDPDPDPVYNIVHDIVFIGVATKDLPSPLRGDLREV